MCPQRSVAVCCITNRIYSDCSRNEPNMHMIMLAIPKRPSATDDGISAAEQPVRFAEANMNSSQTFWGHKNPALAADYSHTLTRVACHPMHRAMQ